IQIIQYSLNISDKKKAEDESEKQKEHLRHADRMISLGILVSGVAHEINNPNNAIILNSSFLKRSYKDIIPILDNYYSKSKLLSIGGLNYNIFKDEINDIFTGITRSSNKIKAIVEELKQYSRKDKLVMRSEVEINLVIKSALNLLHGMIKKSTMDLRVSYKKNLPAIYGNFQNIEQVIINLIQNSCQALTSKDKSVSISTSIDKTEKFIVIEVADEGSGIDEKDLKYIEDPFFTTKRNSGGVGLGLSVSSKIIEEHGGSMSFSSKLNIGTIVRVMLPVLGSKHNGE
ncbi:MAG: GHKL domain-containing protein, partial [Candidatus Aminicenantes bacterium]|nr:GHKL domain-containing protein [Candidatus Aminicenantes bacterium]